MLLATPLFMSLYMMPMARSLTYLLSADDAYLISFAFSRNTSGHLIGCVHKETEKVIHNIVYNVDQAGKFLSSQNTSSVSGKIVKVWYSPFLVPLFLFFN